MSAVQPLQPSDAAARKSLQPGQSFLVGRITDVKRTDKGTFTILATPAPDRYSHPSMHEVGSDRPFGRPGDEVSILVQLGGYRRTFRTKDGDQVVTVDNSLRLVAE
ncbi:MAG: hypothetical protein AW09_001534 [Candidatus Accumulibacter phosphatis]|uniref:Uncharacterized protein n=1 Tax=Candidatus Accumulibacter phosphatis TaxID=327160 RepID=A0A080LWY6_9PROT|nr:MAG: hypothetical protein AW09_001534 [Candidatus Accumulibacter phosphatis]